MAAGPLDLCTLQDVKDYLCITDSSADVKLQTEITRASQAMLNQMNRSDGIYVVGRVERRNGNGQVQISPYFWPLVSVASVQINGQTVPPSSNGVIAGWINDANAIYLVNGGGFPSAGLPFGCGSFTPGKQNIILTYTYGWTPIPGDITEACTEWVAYKFKRRTHIDKNSEGIQGQQVVYSTKSMPDEVKDVIYQYKIKGIVE